jgi:GcrA cell cycle regulator
MSVPWTTADDLKLRELIDLGHSFGLIAAKLPKNRSRNSVIGRANRLGIKSKIPYGNRQTSGAPRIAILKRKSRGGPVRQDKARAFPVSTPPLREPRAQKNHPRGVVNAVLAVRSSQCKWPIGNPQDAAFRFCLHATNNPPYCTYHAGKAYQTREPDAGIRRIR